MSEATRILIVGGGTAGWMTAAALSCFLKHTYRIELVESEQIGTVGVGEATIPQIILFNRALGLDEDDFIRCTQATFKLGIEFVDWLKPNHRYMHAFGAIGKDVALTPFQHLWARARALGGASDLAAYSLNECAAVAGKMQRGPARTAKSLPDMPYAFHFDSMLYAEMLRRYAENRGVMRHEGQVSRVERNGVSGDVASVRLEDGRVLNADIFIDCSGFRGLLIEGALNAGYEDWSHWLPCDSALAVPCARSETLTPYTRSTARSAGWQWRIPLQHRTGNGIVYSSAHWSRRDAEAALLESLDGAPLAEPKPLVFKTGMRKKAWSHNVISIGLASGFLEPLESTSIHLIQSAVARLLKFLPGKTIIPPDVEEYNRQTRIEYEKIRDFIILHYKLNERSEYEFWRYCQNMAVPDGVTQKIEQFRQSGRIFREQEDLFSEVAWLQVMVGQGIEPAGWHPLADEIPEADLLDFVKITEALIAREVDQMPSHDAFVAAHCRADPS